MRKKGIWKEIKIASMPIIATTTIVGSFYFDTTLHSPHYQNLYGTKKYGSKFSKGNGSQLYSQNNKNPNNNEISNILNKQIDNGDLDGKSKIITNGTEWEDSSSNFEIGYIETSNLASFGKVKSVIINFDTSVSGVDISEVNFLDINNSSVPFILVPDTSSSIDFNEVTKKLQDNNYLITNGGISLPANGGNTAIKFLFYESNLISKIDINTSNMNVSSYSIVDEKGNEWSTSGQIDLTRNYQNLKKPSSELNGILEVTSQEIKNLLTIDKNQKLNQVYKEVETKLSNSFAWEGGAISIDERMGSVKYRLNEKKFIVAPNQSMSDKNLLILKNGFFIKNGNLVNEGGSRITASDFDFNTFKPNLSLTNYSFYWFSNTISIEKMSKMLMGGAYLGEYFSNNQMKTWKEKSFLAPSDFGINNNEVPGDVLKISIPDNDDFILGNKTIDPNVKGDLVILDIKQILKNYNSGILNDLDIKYRTKNSTGDWSEWIYIDTLEKKNITIKSLDAKWGNEVHLVIESKKSKWLNYFGNLSISKIFNLGKYKFGIGNQNFNLSSSDVQIGNTINTSPNVGGLSALGALKEVRLRFSHIGKYDRSGLLSEIRILDRNNKPIPYEVEGYYSEDENGKKTILDYGKMEVLTDIFQDDETFIKKDISTKYPNNPVTWHNNSLKYGGGYLAVGSDGKEQKILSGSYFDRFRYKHIWVTLKLKEFQRINSIGWTYSNIMNNFLGSEFKRVDVIQVKNTDNLSFSTGQVSGNLYVSDILGKTDKFNSGFLKQDPEILKDYFTKLFDEGKIVDSSKGDKYYKIVMGSSNSKSYNHTMRIKKILESMDRDINTSPFQISTTVDEAMRYVGYRENTWIASSTSETSIQYVDKLTEIGNVRGGYIDLPILKMRQRYNHELMSKMFSSITFYDDKGQPIPWEISTKDVRYFNTGIFGESNTKKITEVLNEKGSYLGYSRDNSKIFENYGNDFLLDWGQYNNSLKFYFRFKDGKDHKISKVVISANHLRDVVTDNKVEYSYHDFMKNLKLNLFSENNIYKLIGVKSSSSAQLENGRDVTIGMPGINTAWDVVDLNLQLSLVIYNDDVDGPKNSESRMKWINDMYYEIYDEKISNWVPYTSFRFTVNEYDEFKIRYSRLDGGVLSDGNEKYKYFDINIDDLRLKFEIQNKISIAEVGIDNSSVRWEGNNGSATFSVGKITNNKPLFVDFYYKIEKFINGKYVTARYENPPNNITNGDKVYVVFSVKDGYFVDNKWENRGEEYEIQLFVPDLPESSSIDITDTINNNAEYKIVVDELMNMDKQKQFITGTDGRGRFTDKFIDTISRLNKISNFSGANIIVKVNDVGGLHYLNLSELQDFNSLSNTARILLIIQNKDLNKSIIYDGEISNEFKKGLFSIEELIKPKFINSPSIKIEYFIKQSGNNIVFGYDAFQDFLDSNNLNVTIKSISGQSGAIDILDKVPSILKNETIYEFSISPKSGYAFGSPETFKWIEQAVMETFSTIGIDEDDTNDVKFVSTSDTKLPDDIYIYYYPTGIIQLEKNSLFDKLSSEGYKIELKYNGVVFVSKKNYNANWLDKNGTIIHEHKLETTLQSDKDGNKYGEIEIVISPAEGYEWEETDNKITEISKKYDVKFPDFRNMNKTELKYVDGEVTYESRTIDYKFSGYEGRAYFGNKDTKHQKLLDWQGGGSEYRNRIIYSTTKFLPSVVDFSADDFSEVDGFKELKVGDDGAFDITGEGRVFSVFEIKSGSSINYLSNYSNRKVRVFNVDNLPTRSDSWKINELYDENSWISNVNPIESDNTLDGKRFINIKNESAKTMKIIIPGDLNKWVFNSGGIIKKLMRNDIDEIVISVKNASSGQISNYTINQINSINLNPSDVVTIKIIRNKIDTYWTETWDDPGPNEVSYIFTTPLYSDNNTVIDLGDKNPFEFTNENTTFSVIGIAGIDDPNINKVTISPNESLFIPFIEGTPAFRPKIDIYRNGKIISTTYTDFEVDDTTNNSYTKAHGDMTFTYSNVKPIVFNVSGNIENNDEVKISLEITGDMFFGDKDRKLSSFYETQFHRNITNILNNFWYVNPSITLNNLFGIYESVSMSSSITNIKLEDAFIEIFIVGTPESIWSNDGGSHETFLNISENDEVRIKITPNHNKFIIDNTKTEIKDGKLVGTDEDIWEISGKLEGLAQGIKVSKLINMIRIKNDNGGLFNIKYGSDHISIALEKQAHDKIKELFKDLDASDQERISIMLEINISDSNDVKPLLFNIFDLLDDEIILSYTKDTNKKEHIYKTYTSSPTLEIHIDTKIAEKDGHKAIALINNELVIITKEFAIINETLSLGNLINADYFTGISIDANNSTNRNLWLSLKTIKSNQDVYDKITENNILNLIQNGKLIFTLTIEDENGIKKTITYTKIIDSDTGENSNIVILNNTLSPDGKTYYWTIKIGELNSMGKIKKAEILLEVADNSVAFIDAQYNMTKGINISEDNIDSKNSINTDSWIPAYIHNKDDSNKLIDVDKSHDGYIELLPYEYETYNRIINDAINHKVDFGDGVYKYIYGYDVEIFSNNRSIKISDILGMFDLREKDSVKDSEITLNNIIKKLIEDPKYNVFLRNGFKIKIIAVINPDLKGDYTFDYRPADNKNNLPIFNNSTSRDILIIDIKGISQVVKLTKKYIEYFNEGKMLGYEGGSVDPYLIHLLEELNEFKINIIKGGKNVATITSDSNWRDELAKYYYNGYVIEIESNHSNSTLFKVGNDQLINKFVLKIPEIKTLDRIIDFSGFYYINDSGLNTNVFQLMFNDEGHINATIDIEKMFNESGLSKEEILKLVNIYIIHKDGKGVGEERIKVTLDNYLHLMPTINIGDAIQIKIETKDGYLFSDMSKTISSQTIFVSTSTINKKIISIDFGSENFKFIKNDVATTYDMNNADNTKIEYEKIAISGISELYFINDENKIVDDSNNDNWNNFVKDLESQGIRINIHLYDSSREKIIEDLGSNLPNSMDKGNWLLFTFSIDPKDKYADSKKISINGNQISSNQKYWIQYNNLFSISEINLEKELKLKTNSTKNGSGIIDFSWVNFQNLNGDFYVYGENESIADATITSYPPSNLSNGEWLHAEIFGDSNTIMENTNNDINGAPKYFRKVIMKTKNIKGLTNKIDANLPGGLLIRLEEGDDLIFKDIPESDYYDTIIQFHDSNGNVIKEIDIDQATKNMFFDESIYSINIKLKIKDEYDDYFFNSNAKLKIIEKKYSFKPQLIDADIYIPNSGELNHIYNYVNQKRYFTIPREFKPPSSSNFYALYWTDDNTIPSRQIPGKLSSSKRVYIQFVSKPGFANLITKEKGTVVDIDQDKIVDLDQYNGVKISNIYGTNKNALLMFDKYFNSEYVSIKINIYEENKFLKSILVSKKDQEINGLKNGQILELELVTKKGYYFDDYTISHKGEKIDITDLSEKDNIATKKNLIYIFSAIGSLLMLASSFLIFRRFKRD